jgi:predicted acyl esterase
MTCLALGSLRLRYRDDWANPKSLPKHESVKVTVRLAQTAYVFAAGSRVALLVASSDHPRILPNPGNMELFGKPFVARNRVLHGPGARSCLKLPVL